MAYQETEKTRARKEAQKALIINTAIDIIKSVGLVGLETRTLAERAGIAKGLIFHYFADKTEVIAHVEALIKTRDAEAIEQAAMPFADRPIQALAAGIRALVARFSNNRASREMLAHSLAYRLTMLRVFGQLIEPCTEGGEASRTLARAVVGVIRGLAEMDGSAQERAQAAILFALRGIGASAADQRKALELV